MGLEYTPQAVEDLKYWQKSGNQATQKKIKALLLAIEQDPKGGIGKPEQLKHDLTGKWSRRINKEHRIIYEVKSSAIVIHQMRFHY